MLDAASLIAEAEAKVGIADGDPRARGNLERLLSSMAETFPLSPTGEKRVSAMLLMDATNRLESLKWLRDHPEIAEEPIEAPVFLMGLPRSGTTYFQYLFDRDPRFRLIRTWESSMPSPPPGHDPASVASRREAWREMQRRRGHFDGFEALHLYDEDGSDECHAFLQQTWGAAGLNNLYRVPQYFDWLMDELDLVETYRVHKRQLQCLQWRSQARPWAPKYRCAHGDDTPRSGAGRGFHRQDDLVAAQRPHRPVGGQGAGGGGHGRVHRRPCRPDLGL